MKQGLIAKVCNFLLYWYFFQDSSYIYNYNKWHFLYVNNQSKARSLGKPITVGDCI